MKWIHRCNPWLTGPFLIGTACVRYGQNFTEAEDPLSVELSDDKDGELCWADLHCGPHEITVKYRLKASMLTPRYF